MLGWGKNKKPDNTHSTPPQPATGASADRAGAGPTATTPPRRKAPTRTLGEVLVTEGVITEGQRKEALALQATGGGKSLVQILIEKGYLHGNLLSSFLAKRFGLPHVSLVDCLVSEDLFQYVPKDLCQRYSVMPLDKLGTTITLAMVNPLDADALETVRKQCPEMRFKSILCDWNGFQSAVARFLEAKEQPKPAYDLTASSLGLAVPKTPKKPASEAPPPPGTAEPPPPTQADPLQTDPEEWGHLAGFAEQVMKSPAPPATTQPEPSKPANFDAVMLSSKYETYAVLARRLVLFRGLEPMDVAAVFDSGMMIEAAPNQVLFEKGSAEKDLYVILSGEVVIRDGHRDLATLSSGEMFGEMALVTDQPRSASAVAKTTASLFVLNEEKFHQFLSSKISIRMLINMVVTLSERLREADRQLPPPV